VQQYVSPGASAGAQPWTYDKNGVVGPGQTLTTQNSWVKYSTIPGQGCDNNCAITGKGGVVLGDRPGVYPFGCTQCNNYPDTPVGGHFACGPPPIGQYCAAQNGLPGNTGCLLNRNPTSSHIQTQMFGGTVTIAYTGPSIPPNSCTGTVGPSGHTQYSKGGYANGNQFCINMPNRPLTPKEFEAFLREKGNYVKLFQNYPNLKDLPPFGDSKMKGCVGM
jgi:hypothetical protein